MHCFVSLSLVLVCASLKVLNLSQRKKSDGKSPVAKGEKERPFFVQGMDKKERRINFPGIYSEERLLHPRQEKEEEEKYKEIIFC